jgi:hypothetical protein
MMINKHSDIFRVYPQILINIVTIPFSEFSNASAI